MKLLNRFQSLPPEGTDPADTLIPREGKTADYAALARFHYLPPPATICQVLSLIDPEELAPVACLVISHPTLNAWWRPLAWPHLFTTKDPRQRAHLINTNIRTISRYYLKCI